MTIGDGAAIGIYNPVRSIVDAFRLRYREGEELAYVALRRWSRRRGTKPATLVAMARHFPRTVTPIARALEIIQYE
jgi:hypothetical protein